MGNEFFVYTGGKMVRSELVKKISDDNPHLSLDDIDRLVATIFNEIVEAMASGQRVELRGFGVFTPKKYEAKMGRNPRTGEDVAIEEKCLPRFKAGKPLLDRLNG